MQPSSWPDQHAIAETLLTRQYASVCADNVEVTGLYAISLVERAALAPLVVPPSGLLYLKRMTNRFEVRNQFLHPNSGRSTFRRSLGALLKAELVLSAKPYGQTTNEAWGYCFDEAGERRLRDWMRENLCFGVVAVRRRAIDIETRLFNELNPPLNLNQWDNPQRSLIKSFRARCASEARDVADAEAMNSGNAGTAGGVGRAKGGILMKPI